MRAPSMLLALATLLLAPTAQAVEPWPANYPLWFDEGTYQMELTAGDYYVALDPYGRGRVIGARIQHEGATIYDDSEIRGRQSLMEGWKAGTYDVRFTGYGFAAITNASLGKQLANGEVRALAQGSFALYVGAGGGPLCVLVETPAKGSVWLRELFFELRSPAVEVSSQSPGYLWLPNTFEHSVHILYNATNAIPHWITLRHLTGATSIEECGDAAQHPLAERELTGSWLPAPAAPLVLMAAAAALAFLRRRA